MLIKDFFINFNENKDEILKKFENYIRLEKIKGQNSDCPYIKKIVQNRYNAIKKKEITKTHNKLKGFY